MPTVMSLMCHIFGDHITTVMSFELISHYGGRTDAAKMLGRDQQHDLMRSFILQEQSHRQKVRNYLWLGVL